MKSKIKYLLSSFAVLACLLIFGNFSGLSAQEAKQTVLLREVMTPDGNTYTLEATFPFAVRDKCADMSPLKCLSIAATMYSGQQVGNDTVNKIFADDLYGDDVGGKVPVVNIHVAENCASPTATYPDEYPSKDGSFCASFPQNNALRVIYRFTAPPTLKSDKYSIAVTLTPTSTPEVEGFSAAAKLEFTISDPEVSVANDTDITENKNLAFMYAVGGTKKIEAHSNVIKIIIELPPESALTDTDYEKATNARIRLRRVRAILNWLDRQQSNPPGIVKEIKIDLRDGSSVQTYTTPSFITGFAYIGQNESPTDEAVEFPNCNNVPDAIRPLTKREARLYCDNRVTLFLFGKESLPTKPFLMKVTLNDESPLELALVQKATINSLGVKPFVTSKADAIGSNKALGLRSFQTNLDLGLAFTSSVEDVKKDDQTVRERKNNGAIDFMFAPMLDRNLTKAAKDVQWQTTPFFIDAKAATGKISEKTLSLNRILIGGEIALLILGNETKGDETHPSDRDKFKLSFRFINASDRDFKRVEAKFNFQTLFRFVALNRPLSQRTREIPASVLNPKAGPTIIPAGIFGYQIQPIVGFDLGRVYRQDREVFNIEEQSRFVRRLYLGLDMQFDLTRHVKLSLRETFYIRGETPQDRFRNYFIGGLETPIGNIGSNAAQSIFFNFERGDQPPFLAPSVNVLKIGYRITSNFGRNGSIF